MADNTYSQQHDSEQIDTLTQVFARQKQYFGSNPYPSLETRLSALKKLKAAILTNQEQLCQALSQDFGNRSFGDSKMADIMPTVMGINYTIKHLAKWLKPAKRHVGILFQPASASVMYQPLGVVGIITPWNYPVFLSLGPLTTAIAAGNTAMIKMSEFTPNTNEVIKQLLSEVFSDNEVAVVTGGASVAGYFSEQAFDHLLFTGSTNIGKKVMACAAKSLTPVTLELGGKSPTIIAPDFDIKTAVSRFLLGKTLNAGQTCVAPDYVLCPKEKVTELAQALEKSFVRMYPTVAGNQDYTSIINSAQLLRLQNYIEDALVKGAKVDYLGKDSVQACLDEGKLPLAVVTGTSDDMLLMQEEIFGPILPIIPYDDLDDAIAYVNARPRPLALYLCSYEEKNQQQVLEQTHAGGVCINDAAMHVAQDDLPFGGIGPSGMGQYHGHEGFLTFSKAKPIFKKGKLNTASNAFPPYGKLIHKLIYKLFLSK